MDLHLADKVALITGSTAGIGLEITRKLAVEGAKVIVTGRNQAKLDRAVETIRALGGANVLGILADASTAAPVLQAWLTLPSCLASSNRPSLARMIFCSSVMIDVLSKAPRPGRYEPRPLRARPRLTLWLNDTKCPIK